MGWRGTLRSIAAAQRQAEREARRRQRELERQRKQIEKMVELERAAYEVQVYENYIEVLMSVHKDCSGIWDWKTLYASEPPPEPVNTHSREKAAQVKLETFKPGFTDKMFGLAENKRKKLISAVEEARRLDEKAYQDALEAHLDWQGIHALAGNILEGDPDAYINAIRQVDPFSDISELGSYLEFQSKDGATVEAALLVNGDKVIPKETKSLLASGKLSVKKMPITKFYELYQDYVCGCVLRVARELFALLPIEMVIVTAMGEVLNTQTGHIEEKPILSAAIPKDTLTKLNFDTLDPSDSMGNFVHRMNFKKTKGFTGVEMIKPADLR